MEKNLSSLEIAEMFVVHITRPYGPTPLLIIFNDLESIYTCFDTLDFNGVHLPSQRAFIVL
jgi:hypothetical protein